MQRPVTIIGALVVVVSGYILWTRYFAPADGVVVVERTLYMWGALLLISLIMIVAVRR